MGSVPSISRIRKHGKCLNATVRWRTAAISESCPNIAAREIWQMALWPVATQCRAPGPTYGLSNNSARRRGLANKHVEVTENNR